MIDYFNTYGIGLKDITGFEIRSLIFYPVAVSLLKSKAVSQITLFVSITFDFLFRSDEYNKHIIHI